MLYVLGINNVIKGRRGIMEFLSKRLVATKPVMDINNRIFDDFNKHRRCLIFLFIIGLILSLHMNTAMGLTLEKSRNISTRYFDETHMCLRTGHIRG